MYEIMQLSKEYRKGKPVLHELSFSVQSQEIVGLLGVNGAGKTTLIKLMLNMLLPTSGQILFAGKKLCAMKGREYHRQVAAV
ncbi:MAG: ATP-binding cassette domain-containing protein, partial [Oscillospiraceae bacterium]|nr:ATP-binding cassette domain-containing protein [Oscillospiraceae bacterium]